MVQRWSPCNWLRRVHPPVSSSSKRCIFEEASDWWIRWGYFDSIALELSTGFFFELFFALSFSFIFTYLFVWQRLYCFVQSIVELVKIMTLICRRGYIDDTKCTETQLEWLNNEPAIKPVRTRSQSFILLQLCIVGTKFIAIQNYMHTILCVLIFLSSWSCFIISLEHFIPTHSNGIRKNWTGNGR